MLSFVNFGLPVRDCVEIAVHSGFKKIYFGLNFDHYDRILLNPDRKRHKNDFRRQSEKDNRQTVITREHPAPFHQISEWYADIIKYRRHRSVLLNSSKIC